jgi:hypothetical protein
MKKLLLLTACAAAFTVNSFAGIGIAPVVGLNMSNNTGTSASGAKMKIGVHLGVMLNFDITEHLSIEPGLLYSMKGSKQDYTIPIIDSTVEYKLSLNYLEIPINVVYHFGEQGAGGFMVHAGPYLGYALSGKQKVGDSEESLTFKKDEDGFKRMDFGLNFGLGYQLPMGVFVRAQYGLGLGNIVEDPGKAMNTNIAIQIGYRLGYGN